MRLSTVFASLLACICLTITPVLADAPGDVPDYQARNGEAALELEAGELTAEGELFDLYEAKAALAEEAGAALSGDCTPIALMADGSTCEAGSGATCSCEEGCSCTADSESCSCNCGDDGWFFE